MTLLHVSNIDKTYEASPLLQKINFRLEKGQILCLLGPSGCGKSTLLRIIAGLETPDSGQLLWNGKSLGSVPSHNRNFGLMFQDYVLFPHKNVFENIAFGLESNEIDIERVNHVIHLAKLDSWVDTLADGVESIVGEQGVQISGGQRQRIGIARALYRNPEILVFDEATSSLDNLTEKEIMDDIYKMHGDRTMIIIAHRLETIRQCDRIIVLENGRVVGDDKYSLLLQNNKAFQKISLVSSTEF